jgi:hypothetical protein
MAQTKHYFNLEMEPASSFEELPDGGLLVHNVVIMAEGTWRSAQGQVTRFKAPVLKRDAAEWIDNGFWPRHPGGQPRNSTDSLGAVQNQHYDPAKKAVVGDVYMHRRTELSRAAAELMRLAPEKGGIRSVSAETILELEYNAKEQLFEVIKIIFAGLAHVRAGACEACKVPAYGGDGMGENDKKDEGQAPPAGEQGPPAPPAPPGDGKAQLITELLGAIKELTAALKAKGAGAEGGAKDEKGEAFEAQLKPIREEQAAAKAAYSKLEGEHAQLKADYAKIAADYEKLAKKPTPATFQPPAGQDDAAHVVPGVRLKDGELTIRRN